MTEMAEQHKAAIFFLSQARNELIKLATLEKVYQEVKNK
jgi:hypothetical protein